ncbi:MAG: NAD(P)-dependent oxidoreductase [Phycisphaeraceae bacterium]
MKVLVTGASGRLGRRTLACLTEAGHEVIGTDCLPPCEDPPCRFVQADLLDEDAVRGLIEGVDAVVHLGNHASPDKDIPKQQIYLENTVMNSHVFLSAIECGVGCVVFASSIQVICGDRRITQLDQPSCLKTLPLSERTPPCPGNLYALSKLAGEQMLQYLAYRHPDRSLTAIRFPLLVRGTAEVEPGKRRIRRTGYWTHVDEGFAYLTFPDSASLIRATIERRLPGYHVYLPSAGNHLGLTVSELIERYFPEIPLERPIESPTNLIDISTIRSDLDWEPKDVDIFEPEAEEV